MFLFAHVSISVHLSPVFLAIHNGRRVGSRLLHGNANRFEKYILKIDVPQ